MGTAVVILMTAYERSRPVADTGTLELAGDNETV
jgi:hypothetical protein